MSSTRTVIHLDPADPPPTATIVDSIPVVRLSLFPAAVELFLSRNVDEAITQCDELSLCFSQLANKLAQLKHEDEERRMQAAYEDVDRASQPRSPRGVIPCHICGKSTPVSEVCCEGDAYEKESAEAFGRMLREAQ